MEFLGVVDEQPSSGLLGSRTSLTRVSLLSRRGLADDGGYIADLVVFRPAAILWLVVNGMSMLV